MQADCGFHGQNDGPKQLIDRGPTIAVDIGFDPNFTPGNIAAIPVPSMKNIDALVDTGAGQSYIDSVIATILNLPVVDRQNVSGSAGAHVVDVYLAQVRIPSLNMTMWGRFGGVDLIKGGQTHGALLGRTFLQGVSMTYDGATGRVVLSNNL